jgi:hypothetical protein
MNNEGKKVNRAVVLPDDCYEKMMAALKRGEAFSLVGRHNDTTYTKLRSDGLAYEIPSGVPIEPMSKIAKIISNEKADVTTVTNWGRLSLKCGSPVSSVYGYAAFWSREEKMLYIIHQTRDEIIHRESRETVRKVTFAMVDSEMVWSISP